MVGRPQGIISHCVSKAPSRQIAQPGADFAQQLSPRVDSFEVARPHSYRNESKSEKPRTRGSFLPKTSTTFPSCEGRVDRLRMILKSGVSLGPFRTGWAAEPEIIPTRELVMKLSRSSSCRHKNGSFENPYMTVLFRRILRNKMTPGGGR